MLCNEKKRLCLILRIVSQCLFILFEHVNFILLLLQSFSTYLCYKLMLQTSVNYLRYKILKACLPFERVYLVLRQLLPGKIAPNPKTNPNLYRGVIFSGDNCADTVSITMSIVSSSNKERNYFYF